jgi:hypothetical protein
MTISGSAGAITGSMGRRALATRIFLQCNRDVGDHRARVAAAAAGTSSYYILNRPMRPSRTWGAYRALAAVADRAERRERGSSRVATAHRLCSPPSLRRSSQAGGDRLKPGGSCRAAKRATDARLCDGVTVLESTVHHNTPNLEHQMRQTIRHGDHPLCHF